MGKHIRIWEVTFFFISFWSLLIKNTTEVLEISVSLTSNYTFYIQFSSDCTDCYQKRTKLIHRPSEIGNCVIFTHPLFCYRNEIKQKCVLRSTAQQDIQGVPPQNAHTP